MFPPRGPQGAMGQPSGQIPGQGQGVMAALQGMAPSSGGIMGAPQSSGPNKQSILAAVAQALDAMGMPSDDGDPYGEGQGVSGSNPVPVWSQLKAGTLGQGGGPIHDKSSLMGMDRLSKPPTVNNYGMPVDDGSDEMMSAMGLV